MVNTGKTRSVDAEDVARLAAPVDDVSFYPGSFAVGDLVDVMWKDNERGCLYRGRVARANGYESVDVVYYLTKDVSSFAVGRYQESELNCIRY